jgi:hypothetical protein
MRVITCCVVSKGLVEKVVVVKGVEETLVCPVVGVVVVVVVVVVVEIRCS